MDPVGSELCWPFNEDTYTSDLEHGAEIQSALKNFAANNLSNTTSIRALIATSNGTIEQDEEIDERQLRSALIASHDLSKAHRFFFVNRFLVENSICPSPKDSKKLRISATAFQHCISRLNVSPAFIFALTRYYLPSGQGFRSIPSLAEPIFDFWYFLPVRMQVRCTDQVKEHTSSTAGSNQMNPFNYLHLPDRQADIRGHHIALYARYNKGRSSATLLVFDFIDGRWSKSAREPYHRLKEAIGQSEKLGLSEDIFYPHLVFFTSALRWWGGSLDSLNDQLIKYERRLQEDQPPEIEAQLQKDISKALHAMAAHLHRYCSELKSIANSIDNLKAHHSKIYAGAEGRPAFKRVEDGFWQVATQLSSTKDFEEELEKKTQNILALLFNRIQLSNDRMIVSNGNVMQEIMRATQNEAIRSQELAVEMKRDSLSMKTIAVLTMFFLPGTSFAALLAMPFFSTNKYLTETSRLWVWIALTVPSTCLAFSFYLYWKGRGEGKAGRDSLRQLCFLS